MHPDQTERSSTHFLAAAVACYAQFGIGIRRVLTDNGPCYKAIASPAPALSFISHRRTRPYTPRTNGKAERFIQTAINEWAYAKTYQNSQERTSALPTWTHQYNWHRPHASLNQQPPISRAALDVNNLLTHHKGILATRRCRGSSSSRHSEVISSMEDLESPDTCEYSC